MLKVLRGILLALLASFVTGIAIGTWIRIQMETPERYFIGGMLPDSAGDCAPLVATSRAPGDVCNASPVVLDPRHHEQQVG
jgi:hypothetical protein